jgi:hypothetical protein
MKARTNYENKTIQPDRRCGCPPAGVYACLFRLRLSGRRALLFSNSKKNAFCCKCSDPPVQWNSPSSPVREKWKGMEDGFSSYFN